MTGTAPRRGGGRRCLRRTRSLSWLRAPRAGPLLQEQARKAGLLPWGLWRLLELGPQAVRLWTQLRAERLWTQLQQRPQAVGLV